jgi:hypothetical protein
VDAEFLNDTFIRWQYASRQPQLDRGKPATASVVPGSSSQVTDFTIQFTLDDIMRVSSSLVAWSGVSSAPGQPAQHFTSTGSFPDGVTVGLLSPATAVRLNSTAISSGSLAFRVVQGE